jgi:hypothetical protein
MVFLFHDTIKYIKETEEKEEEAEPNVEDVVFLARSFYVSMNFLVLYIFGQFDNDLKREWKEGNWFYFLELIVLYILTTVLFFTAGSNPGDAQKLDGQLKK